MPQASEQAIVLAPVTMSWFKEQFRVLNDKLDTLLSNDDAQTKGLKHIKKDQEIVLENQATGNEKLDQILAILQPPASPDSPITPELEAAVNAISKMASSIDQKVPDQPPPVPPGTTTP